MKFSGRIKLGIILKVTKSEFYPFLKKLNFGKVIGVGGLGQINPRVFLSLTNKFLPCASSKIYQTDYWGC